MDTDGRCAAPQRPAPAPSPCPLHVRSGPRLDVLACRSARGGGGRSSGDAARGVVGGEVGGKELITCRLVIGDEAVDVEEGMVFM